MIGSLERFMQQTIPNQGIKLKGINQTHIQFLLQVLQISAEDWRQVELRSFSQRNGGFDII